MLKELPQSLEHEKANMRTLIEKGELSLVEVPHILNTCKHEYNVMNY